MIIYLGADHRGFELKRKIALYLAKRNYPAEEIGSKVYDKNDDYPKIAALVALAVIGNDDESRGILICGGGQGVAMAANRFNGIRAAVVSSAEAAKWARHDNDANVLCLSADLYDGNDNWQNVIEIFLKTRASKAERHRRRIKQLDGLA